MKRKWKFLLIPPAAVLFITICGEVVMHLWNWLLPPIFGWRQITFWQGLGLLVLSRLLFGGFGNHSHNHSRWRHSREGRAEHWERMTSEEREKLRQSLHRSRGSGFEGAASETSEPA